MSILLHRRDTKKDKYFSDWLGCAAQCAEHPECEYWTYVFAAVHEEDKACYLKSACPIKFPDIRAYSGTKDCVFWDCSDWTNVEDCKSTPAPKNP